MSQALLHHKIYRHPEPRDWVVLVHGAGGSSNIWFRQLKAYRAQFNVLLLDLRGHGASKEIVKHLIEGKYCFRSVTRDVLQLLDHLRIRHAHFVGISLGTIVIRTLAELEPHRVKTMVLGGAVTRLNRFSQVLVKVGNALKNVVPYMWLYRLFAWIIMPKKAQAPSRHLFIREAHRLCQKEFKRWFRLAAEVNPLMRYFKEKELSIPTLYIMGDNDHMFLKPVKEMAHAHRHSNLAVIEDCGHVCNVEKAEDFNSLSLAFLTEHSEFSALATRRSA
ncbi:alpha/beta hydrolase fold protein [Ferrimonas balearica DSM 9799]|uniref:Alpha/beta hydrolase fold protein n=1 Tax=Ferrimonas balearica (strain DSM 9799 / CCM 4581 / KCTC 23876 / PAT) TaxID=550540 RepID=E1SVN3_FERBD|nr:alpha/beta hydrolase [Ferrimonas balearica]ADN76364.1 alpha/beta hydrolase fold protein [Ferrimonas balearica DSM 9799]